MQQSSIVNASANMGDVGGSSIFKALNGRLDDLAGPIDGSLFKMLITPSKDPAVFNALIWTGYDTLGLEDVEFTDGVGISGNFMSQSWKWMCPAWGHQRDGQRYLQPGLHVPGEQSQGQLLQYGTGTPAYRILRGGNPLQQHQWKMGSLYKGWRL